jgi:NAD(P) transhydrogenase subunit alpha
MIVAVLREPEYEPRVSMLAETTTALLKNAVQVWTEASSGERAFCNDEDYAEGGAVIKSKQEIVERADVLLAIHPETIPPFARNKVLVGIYQPLYQYDLMQEWATRGLTSFSLDMLPRTTRAQSMDVLSSQANIAGYKAVLMAAGIFPRYFPMFMTAAGSIPPAKVLVLGAGVAGLQAIATARRLGAIVEVFDTRPAVREEVMSLGGKFIEVEGAADVSAAGGYAVEQSDAFRVRQMQKIGESIAKADIVITTAQIPGKPAPVLVTGSMVGKMKNGSVIIDLAAATGGNTELTRNNETILHNGVTIVGHSALAATMPYDASKLYGKNVYNFLQLIITKDGAMNLDFEDELVKGACITHQEKIINERIRNLLVR